MQITQLPAHPSNYTQRETRKRGIVFHWIVGELSAADATFRNPSTNASAHYGIGSDGTVHQYVEDKYMAWHAGNYQANLDYIGIEHAGGQIIGGVRKKPTERCHQASIELCTYLAEKHGFTPQRGINSFRHHEVSNRPTSCCGSLNVDRIVAETVNNLNSNLSRMEKLALAHSWNNKIKEKKYLRATIKLVESGNFSKLVGRVDNKDLEDLLIELHELANFIRSRPRLKNNIRTDVVLARFAKYLKASTAV